MNASSSSLVLRPGLPARRAGFASFFRAALAVLSLAALGAPVSAEEPSLCEIRCTPPKPASAFIEIDANTGEILAGSRTFAEGEKVQVIISGKNPYKYAYRTQIVTSPLDTSLVTAFLGLIPGAGSFGQIFPDLASSGRSTETAENFPLATPAQPGDPCAGKEAELEKIEDAADKVVTANNDLKSKATEKEKSYKAYEKFLLDTDGESLGTRCVQVCNDANALLPKLADLSDVKEIKEKAAALEKASGELGKEIAKFKEGLPANRNQCGLGERIEGVEKIAEESGAAAKKALEVIAEIEKAKPMLDSLAKIIRKVQVDNRAFFDERFPPTEGEPAGVQVTLYQTNLREANATEKEVGKVDLTVGRSRFSLSAGVGFSTIEDVTIVKQGDKFAEENESDLRPSLTVMLNTQLGRFWKAEKGGAPDARVATRNSWGLATGLVLTQRNSTTEAEFIVGPSFGFLDDRFFVVLGYHTARVQSLRSEDIPAGTTDIPVDKDWESGAMLAFTYKLR